MKIKLKTERRFLKQNFEQLRNLLLGKGKKVIVSRKARNRSLTVLPHPVIIFDNSSRKRFGAKLKKLGLLKGRGKKSIFDKPLVKWSLNLMITASFLVFAVIFAPKLYYLFFPTQTVKEASLINQEKIQNKSDTDVVKEEINKSATQSGTVKKVYLPPQDEGLPEGDWIIIPRIGVSSTLQKTEDPETALATGIWWVPDFGKPGEFDQPMIVAAHRYGWQWWWKTDYWRYHSFYYLPETKPGDIIEIISNQRKWLYEIYAGEQGAEITDYEADLILYTCKHLNSPVRYFRYARMVLPRAEENL